MPCTAARPKPRPIELRRVEGVEDFGLCLLGHSAAGVGDLQVAVIARGQIEFALHGSGFSDAHLPRADGDLSGLALERFPGIRNQVQDDLPDLRRVRLYRGQILTQVDIQNGRLVSAAVVIR